MRLYALAYACRLYAALGDFDSSIKKFRRLTRPAFDVANPAHRRALFEWLNSWGCRQFAKSYHQMASKALVEWAERYLKQLPSRAGTGKCMGALVTLVRVHL